MTRHFLSLLLSLTCAALAAQSAPCDYAKLMREGRDSLQAKKYPGALKKFNAARTCDRDKSPEVDNAVDSVFRAIEGEKEDALRQKKRADEARRRATEAEEKAKKETEVAKKALARSDSLYELADSEKKRAEAVLDKIYFYKDRFGLAFDKNWRLYGFIDKQLNIRIDFQYLEAQPFENTGYARVKQKDNAYYLIDTIGRQFRLADNIGELNPWVYALDLRHNGLYRIHDIIFLQEQLEVLLLADNNLYYLSPKIGQMKNLLDINLSRNQLGRFSPLEIMSLENLGDIDLDDSRLSCLPVEIGHLQNLRSLNLSNNQLSSLPAEIGQLTNLQTLDLFGNQLSSLPAEIRNLKSLKYLDLRKNPFSADYIEQLRKDMPWCEIKF